MGRKSGPTDGAVEVGAALAFEPQQPLPGRDERVSAAGAPFLRSFESMGIKGEAEGETVRAEAEVDMISGSSLLLDEQQDPFDEGEGAERKDGQAESVWLLLKQLHLPPRRQLQGLRSCETATNESGTIVSARSDDGKPRRPIEAAKPTA